MIEITQEQAQEQFNVLLGWVFYLESKMSALKHWREQIKQLDFMKEYDELMEGGVKRGSLI